MDEPITTQNNDGGEAADCDEPDPEVRAQDQAGAVKFTFASGSRPLDGFTIKRGIGIGGFGEVYFAISDAGKEVALKHIQRNLDVEMRGVRQCLNLKHPNLVALYDIRYDQNGSGWVVMEYISGVVLRDVINAHPQGMPLTKVRTWLAGIVGATVYLHDHGIVHRDLKPGNLFLDEEEEIVKIGDYGLSKFISVSRRSGQTESVGTFHYMAPEIGKGIYGKEIDVYAVGIVLYEMLTGNVPFDGESSQEIIMKHLTDKPDLRPLPSPYDRVVGRALTKDPANRYSHVADIVAELDLDEKKTGHERVLTTTSDRNIEEQDAVCFAEEINERDMVFGPLEDKVQPDVVGGRYEKNVEPNHGRYRSESISKVVQGNGRRTHSWLGNGTPLAPLKVLLLIFLGFFLVGNAGWMLPVTITVIFVYLCYLVIRATVLDRPGTPVPVATAISPPAEQSADKMFRGRSRPHRTWQEHGREMIRSKSNSQQITEVIGSMIMSAVVIVVLGAIVMIWGGRDLTEEVMVWVSTYAWLILSSIAGAWTILIGTKRWEGYQGDVTLRRFALLWMGLLVGIACFGLFKMLLVEPQDLWFSGQSNSLVERYPEHFYSSSDGAPQLLTFLSYFAGLFVVLRFWKQTDPLRSSRLSLFVTAVCVLWALALHAFLPFPHGVMLAGMISIAVQLSAPWFDSDERSRIRQVTYDMQM